MDETTHSLHQKDLPVRTQVLNISVNMARVAGWVEKEYPNKRDLIAKLLSQTDSYLQDLASDKVAKRFQTTLERFKSEFKKLCLEEIQEKNRLEWSERALTWADILQIRAKFLSCEDDE